MDKAHPPRPGFKRPVTLVLLFACLVCGPQNLLGARFDQSVQVEIRGGLVSIEAREVDFRDLMQEIAARGGVKVWIAEGLPPRSVSVSFDSVPLEQVLHELLADTSHALVFDRVEGESRISQVYVLPPGESMPATVFLEPPDSDADIADLSGLASMPTNRTEFLNVVLRSDRLPDNVKAAILSRSGEADRALPASAMPSRGQVLTRLIELLDKQGNASENTMQLLRNALEQEQLQ